MSGLNLVHKVGVIFHAQDRLSSSMDKIGNKFTGLEAKQKAFERSQRQAALSENKLAAAQLRSDSAARRSSMTRQSLTNQEARAQTRLTQLMDEQTKKVTAFWADHTEKVKAMSESQSAFEQTLRERRLAQTRTMLETLDKLDTTYAAKQARNAQRIQGAQHKLNNLEQRGVYRLPPDQLARAEEDADAFANQARGLRLRGAANPAHDSNGQLRRLESAESGARAQITRHQSVVQQEADLERLYAEQSRLEAEYDAQRNAQQQKNVAGRRELRELDQERVEARQVASNKELVDWEILNRTKLEGLNEQIVQAEAQMEVQRRYHQMQTDNLAIENGLRETGIAQLAQQNLEQEALLTTQKRQLTVLERIKGVHSAISQGAGMMLGGAMGLGAVVYGANHVVKESSDYSTLQNEIANNVYGRYNAKGQSYASVINNKIASMHGVVSANGITLQTTPQQLSEIVLEQLGQGIKYDVALANIPGLAQMVRLMTLTPGVSEKSVMQTMPQIYEAARARNQTDIQTVNDAVAKGHALSPLRMTPTNILRSMQQASPYMAALHLDFSKSMPFVDFALSHMKSGASVGTANNMFLQTLLEGGTSIKKQALWGALISTGMLKRGPLQLLRGANGKPLRAPSSNGRTPGALTYLPGTLTNVAGKGEGDIIAALADTLARDVGARDIEHATSAQAQRALQLMGVSANMRAQRLIAPYFNKVDRLKFDQINSNYVTAPGLHQQLKGKGSLYANDMKDFQGAWGTLMTDLGTTWLPIMTQVAKEATAAANGLDNFVRHHPRVAQGALWGGLALGAGYLATGAARMTGLWGAAKWGATELAPNALAMWGARGATTAATTAGDSAMMAVIQGNAMRAGGVAAGTTFASVAFTALKLAPWAALGALIGWGLMDYAHTHHWFGWDAPGTGNTHLNSKSQDQRVRAALKAGNVHAANQIMLGSVNEIPDLLHSSQTHLPAAFPQGHAIIEVRFTGNVPPSLNKNDFKHTMRQAAQTAGNFGVHSKAHPTILATSTGADW